MSETMTREEMATRLGRINDLPTLPIVAMEVGRMLDDMNTSVAQLAHTIERDQALTAKILRLVNSAFFGLRGLIGNVSRAVIVLGFNTVRSAVLSVSVVGAFAGRRRALEGFDIAGFWTHAIGVAVISRRFACQLRTVPPDDAFTAGLLHDVGKLVMYEFFPAVFDRVWTASVAKGIPFYEAERQLSPMAHPAIGKFLMRQWQLSAELQNAVAGHHRTCPDAGSGLSLSLGAADTAARHLAAHGVIGADTAAAFQASGAPAALVAMLEDADAWYGDIRPEIDAATAFFMEGR